MKQRPSSRHALLAGAALAALGPARAQAPAAPVPAVLTQHNDNARTGANGREAILNVGNVNPAHFGKLFSRAVDGYLYAQPLYVPNLAVPGKGTHNVVFLATAHNSVYAFDADDPKASDPLWKTNLGPSVPADEVYTTQWTDMRVEIGITSTPVIDPTGRALFAEAKTKEGGTYVQRLHALDLATGRERPGSPVLIQASVPGTGQASVNGRIAFDPVKQLQRPGLLLSGGVVYLGFGAHADQPPFHGWILGYDARTLAQRCVFNVTPDGEEGSIWQAGMGLAADARGDIYAMTGNGTFDADTGGRDYSNSLLRLRPAPGGLSVVDYFTPHDQAELNVHDRDLGASGPLLIPGMDLVLGGGKNGWLYLARQSRLGKYHAGEDDSQIVQSFAMTPGNIHGSPVFWNGPGGPTVYLWAEYDHLKALKLAGGRLSETPASQSADAVPDGMPGGFLSLSSDGGRAGTGIVWSCAPYDANANWETVPGIVRAFDASDLSRELWDSKRNAARDDAGMFAKFCAPTVVNGRLYVSTFSGQLQVYGLLPGVQPAITKASAGARRVTVTYRSPVDRASAARPGAYALDGGARILRAALGPDGRTVTLSTTPLRPGRLYTLTAGGVGDRDNPLMRLPPNTHAWLRPPGTEARR
jgi:outer membrane protein assembly factor BamB